MILEDFINLLLPKICAACGTLLVRNERIICLKCQYDLPKTRYDSYLDNAVAQLFWGRIPVENAISYFRYQKGSRFQSLIHDLKYRDRKDIGQELGRLLGIEIKGSSFSDTDLILPVPLHKSKQRKRGYNQCDPICEGLSESLEIPYNFRVLERPGKTSSQTNKSRIDRWTNVEGIFRVIQPDMISNKHILLADDVVTTGSTLEACASAILKIEGSKVSIATLAMAPKSF